MSDTAHLGRRRPKGDKRQRTRAALVEAAVALIREKGYDGLTMAEVAERAGMTTGAIYGNFKNRDELFLAVGELRGGPIVPKLRPGMSLRDMLAAYAEAVIAAIPERRAAAKGMLGYHAYALANETMRQSVLARTREGYRLTAEGLAHLVPARELPMPAEDLVRLSDALTAGLLLKRFVTPELISDDLIRAAFLALAGGGPIDKA